MPIGPGKYNDLTTEVRKKTHAAAALVMVFNGDKGTGFSLQAPPELEALLPGILRRMADDIEAGYD